MWVYIEGCLKTLYFNKKNGGYMPETIIKHLNPIALAAKDRLKEFKYRFDIIAKASLVDMSDDNAKLFLSRLDLKNNKPNDFIIMKSILATSLPYVNGNGDAFRPEDLSAVVNDGQLSQAQPAIVDWNHDFMPRGNTIGAEIIDARVDAPGVGKADVKQLVVYSVFYSWLYPYEGDKIREWAKKNILTFSMACGSEEIEWMGDNRILVKPQFLANSIITPERKPADDNAKLINIANKNRSDDMDKIKELENKIAELQKTIAEKDKQLAEFGKTELVKQVDELKTAVTNLEKTKQDLEKEKQELAEAKEKEKVESQTKFDALQATIDELKKANKEMFDKLMEIKKAELENINKERKEKLATFITDEEKLNSWFEKYQASITENGEIVVDNGYNEFVSVLEETAKASKDVGPTDKVTASQKVVPPNNTIKGDKLFKTWV